MDEAYVGSSEQKDAMTIDAILCVLATFVGINRAITSIDEVKTIVLNGVGGAGKTTLMMLITLFGSVIPFEHASNNFSMSFFTDSSSWPRDGRHPYICGFYPDRLCGYRKPVPFYDADIAGGSKKAVPVITAESKGKNKTIVQVFPFPAFCTGNRPSPAACKLLDTDAISPLTAMYLSQMSSDSDSVDEATIRRNHLLPPFRKSVNR